MLSYVGYVAGSIAWYGERTLTASTHLVRDAGINTHNKTDSKTKTKIRTNTAPLADAAIVLGAAVWDGQPSPVFEERINHGIWLYQHHKVKTLIFTGGVGAGDTQSEAQVAKAYAIAHGVPASAILLEGRSKYTRENLRFIQPVIVEAGVQTVLIVSDPLHMKRAMCMATDFGLQAKPSPTPTTRYQSMKAKAKMLWSETKYYLGYVWFG
ncbi:EpiH/GdmH-related protein [Photobacterium aphoticum]|uniref:EpiH/GdmH-related protein n=1 Tax=Photobacterium aphoticum TaxID=754436 RepID=A0A090QK44_9GAMM|nr:EpiH/GdmH-related protein [Photobacterium aphoticum]